MHIKDISDYRDEAGERHKGHKEHKGHTVLSMTLNSVRNTTCYISIQIVFNKIINMIVTALSTSKIVPVLPTRSIVNAR